ncbi:MAG: gamma-glutamylcyclotransferase [Alphaproteobacteria bacterium]|nr:gamma-glutamylcyclotransferase [Alphaproteobacteria bacterium]
MIDLNGVGRDAIKDGFFQRMAEEGQRKGLIQLCTEEEREASWRGIMSENPNPCESIWIFAYGSLLWNPAFHFVDRKDCSLFGYHRDFCLKTWVGRGSEDQPGLVLGLKKGGSCRGQALKVDPSRLEEELHVIWSREMLSGAYRPKWVSLKTPDGPVNGVAFVMNTQSMHYAGDLEFEEICHMLATARGALGYAADYLFETASAMRKIGIVDRRLTAYEQAVRRLRE